MDSASNALASASTDSTGTYRMAAPVGTFTVTCGAGGYITTSAGEETVAPASVTKLSFNLVEDFACASIQQLRSTYAVNSAGGTVDVSLNTACVATDSASAGTIAGGFYIEEPNRSTGIRVQFNGSPTVSEGDRVTVTAGYLGYDSDGELCLYAQSITDSPGQPLRPLGMANKSVGLPASPSNSGGLAEYGTVGLLVTIWGKVTAVDPGGTYIYIDDGRGVSDGTGPMGVRVMINSAVTAGVTPSTTS